MQTDVNVPLAVGALLSAIAALLHLGIAAVLAAWSAYALAGAGLIGTLPLLKAALAGITAVYLVRGIVYAPLVLAKGGRITPFVVWSSLICFAYGLVHLLGLVQRWPAL
jgi:uncharacterized membrane-anchored protein